ncbi:MAG: hypothetical protein ABSA76_00570 [Bacteroidales bacterium]
MTDSCVHKDGVAEGTASSHSISSAPYRTFVILSEAKNLSILVGQ